MRSDLVLLHELGSMLTTCRPFGSATERQFIADYLTPLGAVEDRHGNQHVIVGDAPILWSCHTDTVHDREGSQRIRLTDGWLHLTKAGGRTSGCLGADDTVGVFLCRNMILAGVPGHYVFHFGEECGCIGSRRAAFEEPDWLTGLQAAIAFDRKGTADIITHQCGRRTASDAFAASLALQLNVHGLAYQASDRGLYTDTESYADVIPECSNVSIGYEGAHGGGERVHVAHVLALLRVLEGIDSSAFVIARNPADLDTRWGSVWTTGGSVVSVGGGSAWWSTPARVAIYDSCQVCGIVLDEEDLIRDKIGIVCIDCYEASSSCPLWADAAAAQLAIKRGIH